MVVPNQQLSEPEAEPTLFAVLKSMEGFPTAAVYLPCVYDNDCKNDKLTLELHSLVST